MTFTLIIIVLTVLVSLASFNDKGLENKLILWPRYMDTPDQYYRLLTSGFIHADWNHLLLNMFSLYFAGVIVESYGSIQFAVLYLTGIIVASLPSFLKNRNNSHFRSLGASGGVAAIMFFFIYHNPWGRITLFFIPIPIPALLFGVIYLGTEAYMAKRGSGNVNHDAHFWGSAYGFLFAILTDPTHGLSFLYDIMNPR